EFVASAVIDNLMRVQMDTAMPVFSAVLTPQNFDAGEEHTAYFKNHFIEKGQEVAQACANTLEALSNIS
ncbi:MAG TPA: 6,7-dimethyl-8-ribityllumazine synthase, partial [Porticoccaceae bacterium]|nr:6,7-dimethyl-8-ribityllumazine synthase [Porticoccaceae bacterium]